MSIVKTTIPPEPTNATPSPSAKQLARAYDRFKAAVAAYLIEEGAKSSDYYDFVLDTPAGVLHVTPYGGWIACRFDDVARGRTFTSKCGRSCNPYSGKWNFIYFDSIAALAPEVVLADFGFYLEMLLAWQPAPCPADVIKV